MRNEFGRVKLLKDWNDWDNYIHADEHQIQVQGSAITYPFPEILVDYEHTCAEFLSTSFMSSLLYYKTTLKQCSCKMFARTHLPCKHIYRLAVELGVIEIFKRQPKHTFDKELLNNIRNSSNIDNEPDQIKRQENARNKKYTPISINFEEKTATFSGSGNNIYLTTYDTCTCRDYFLRKLPCKHIYRLRFELEEKSNLD